MADKDIVNYDDIRDSLELLLEEEAPDSKEKILASLDDSLGNQSDQLVLEEDI